MRGCNPKEREKGKFCASFYLYVHNKIGVKSRKIENRSMEVTFPRKVRDA